MRTQFSVPGLYRCLAIFVLCISVASCPAWAETRLSTVGPCGSFATIQDAIDAAVNGDETDIRVQADNVYIENLVIPSSFNSGALSITGGWDCPFDSSEQGGNSTIIDAGGAGSAVKIHLSGGFCLLAGFTLTNGEEEKGGGIDIQPSGDALVTLENLVISTNIATSSGIVRGGGINANLDGSESLEVHNVVLRDNRSICTGRAAAYGGGISITAEDDAQFLMSECRVEKNKIASEDGSLLGAGMHISAADQSMVRIEDCLILDNSPTGGQVLASGVHLQTTDSTKVVIERLELASNRVTTGEDRPQLRIIADDLSSVIFRDSGIVRGDAQGLEARAWGGSSIYLTNLTVVQNQSSGAVLAQYPPAHLNLFNTILYDNGVNLQAYGNVNTGSNLVGIDPKFINASSSDYHLDVNSPALDAGVNNPPGGLGITDMDGQPRIFGDVVDIGMYEGGERVFLDSFETGDLSGWWSSSPTNDWLSERRRFLEPVSR